MISSQAYSQEKIKGLELGFNKMKANSYGADYKPLIGFQAGIFLHKKTPKSFFFEKGIYLTYTRFEDRNSQNTLLLKNESFSLSIPIKLYWTKIKVFHPFIGLEGIWRFSIKTDYYMPDIPHYTVSPLQLGFIVGADIIFHKKISFGIKYLTTPYLISYGQMDLTGFLFSIRYKLGK